MFVKATMTVLTIISIILIESAAAGKSSMNNIFGVFDSSDTVSDVKELVSIEKKLNKEEPAYCIKDKKTLDAVRADKNAWEYMINEICTKFATRKNATQYLEDEYGMKQGNPEDKFLNSTTGNPSTAVVPLELNEALFLKLNGSECIKKSLDVTELANYRMIKDCVWPKDETTPYLIMDKYTGTFEDKIVNSYGAGWETDNYPKGEALEDMIKITEELLGLHEKKIAHRDLRPENIVVDENGIPFLSNFDMITLFGEETIKGPIETIRESIESPDPYMDYEMRLKRSEPISSDIYSLFIIFARIFLGDTALDTIVGIIKENKKRSPFEKLLDLVPDDFKWTKYMLENSLTFRINTANKIGKNECRWSAHQVLDELTKMKNKLDLQERLLI